MPFRWPLAQHIYLSPHLDDVVLSCGGLLFEQARRSDTVAVITLFAASPSPRQPLSAYAQSLHQRWQASAPPEVDFSDPPALRRAEDLRALAALHPSIQVVHADMLDCIYRTDPASGKALYTSEEAIFGAVQPSDPAWVHLQSASALPQGATLYSPLGIGYHVDHQVVRCSVEAWGLSPQSVRYYEDYPYVASPGALEAALGTQPGWKASTFPITDEALSAKTCAVAEYASQISTFWENEEAMRTALREQARLAGGERFWQLSG
jgi:LmbE family N-acetylglucosaminyl deacetylase